MKFISISHQQVVNIMIGIGMVVLVGCSAIDNRTQTKQVNPTKLEPKREAPPSLQAETGDPGFTNSLSLENTDPTPTVITATAPIETEVLPTPRINLEATSPSSVDLASGQLQLVEFFAFW